MIDKKTYEDLMSYLVKVECNRLKEEQNAQSHQSASKSGIEHRSNGMQGSASSKNTATSGGKKQKLIVSNFVQSNGTRESAEKIIGKIVKSSNINAVSNPSPLHTEGSNGGTSVKSTSQPKPARQNNGASSSVKRINTTVGNGATAPH